MAITGFVSGWVSDPHYVEDVVSMRTARGDAVSCLAFQDRYHDQLQGGWSRAKARGVTGIFLRDKEVIVNGYYRRPYLQRAGTCVARGTDRGVQTSMDVACASGRVLKTVECTFAPVYSLARVEVGRSRLGYGDGAILADAMTAIHDYGVATTDLFKGMTEDQIEQLAVKYATPGQMTPQEWIDACSGHTCRTFSIETLDWLFDVITAGYAVPYASGYITGDPNDSGISNLGSAGGHCRCFTGVFVDEHGQEQLESSESWGAFPARQPQATDQTCPVRDLPRITLKYAGGTKQLAPGSVGVNAKQFWSAIQDGGEAWGVSAPLYVPTSLQDIT